MGRGIATRLLSGGNSVTIMDRDNAEAQKLAGELRSAAKGNVSVKAAEMGSPINSEAVILAVYYPSVPAILSQHGNLLAGKIIVDITNPLNATFDDLATPPGSSVAEEIAKQAPASAKVVKAFNTTFAGTLMAGQVAGQSLDVFIAGDDQQVKDRLAEAFRTSGLRPIDVGPFVAPRLPVGGYWPAAYHFTRNAGHQLGQHRKNSIVSVTRFLFAGRLEVENGLTLCQRLTTAQVTVENRAYGFFVRDPTKNGIEAV